MPLQETTKVGIHDGLQTRGRTGTWTTRVIYISGTSIATLIAAGIAANVPEYARHCIDELNERRKERFVLWAMHGKIFGARAEKRNDYHYVQPWTFWEERFRGGRWRGYDYPEDDAENVVVALSYIISRV